MLEDPKRVSGAASAILTILVAVCLGALMLAGTAWVLRAVLT